jgi:hypothetical protein
MKIDPTLKAICKKHGLNPETDLWDCHGNWIAYHKALERVATESKITFDPPYVVQSDLENKTIAICVTGNMGDSVEWSIGEAAPYNNKNSYPAAMAEKRAKDRVILKLLGLHGYVYSEEEADSFKESKPQVSKAHSRELYTQLEKEIRTVGNSTALEKWGVANKERIGELHPDFQQSIRGEYKRRLDELKAEKEAA